MRIRISLVLVLSLITLAHSRSDVALCDLLRHADEYRGKDVTVRATLKYGFEIQQLYCLDCLDKGRVWLDISDEQSVRKIEKLTGGMGLVNVTVRGRFASGSKYGHENGYDYQLTAVEIGDLELVAKGSVSKANSDKAEAEKACGGTHPR